MSFNHINSIGQRDIISSLEDNIKSFLDYSFLEIGGFVNITSPATISSQPAPYKLHPVSGDPSVTFPKTWATQRKDWIFEDGVSHNGDSPIAISGININGTFLPAPSGSGNYGYYMDYPNGRITFNNNVSVLSQISMNYSYRLIQVYKASGYGLWREIVNHNYNLNNLNNNSLYVHNSIQLPAIFIETIARSASTPHELGTTKNILQQDVLLHIFSHNIVYRNNLIDILIRQKDNSFLSYDINKLAKNNKQFMNFRGEPNPNRLNYASLSLYRDLILNTCYIKNSTNTEMQSFSDKLHHAIVRWTIEIFP